jgi:hypothetical protein
MRKVLPIKRSMILAILIILGLFILGLIILHYKIIADIQSKFPQTKSEPNQKTNSDISIDQSLKIWQDKKVNINGNYFYLTRRQSWTGSGQEMKVIIKSNQVTERYFHSWDISQNRDLVTKEIWSEVGRKQLGSHKEAEKNTNS